MKHPHRFAKFYAAAWIFTVATAAAQSLRFDSIQYDPFGGFVTLGWQGQPGGIYSIESTTNLTVWEQTVVSGQPLRLRAATGGLNQLELGVPAGPRRFWRATKRPITDLGALGGYPNLSDVNDSGRVVGYFNGGSQIGFTWSPGEELVSFGPGSYTGAVNSSGIVVGTRYSVGKFFSWTKSGGLVELGSGIAIDVNEAGDILGRDDSGAFLWKAARGKIRIPHLSSTAGYTVPVALSDAGHVVGDSVINGNYYRAFLWTEAGGLIDLTGSLSSAASGAMDVNASGQVVGHRQLSDGQRAFLWSAAGGFVTFPPGCYITDLSENGRVVGRGYTVGTRGNAFSWTRAGGIVDLGDGMPEAVNELGQIVGYATPLAGAGEAPVIWSPGGDRAELEALSSSPLGSTANLINNNGVVYGVSHPSDHSAHVVMWTVSSNP